jgi:DNA polymerase IV (DinB-like DNA polymerase)
VADEEDDPRVVVHVDMDCFYASCERRRDPSLAGEPVVVGMGYEAGETAGAVATASYEARAYGVESAMSISRALDLLPRRATADDPADTGVYLPVDMEFYQSVAGEVKAVLRDLADTVREVSVDEAYLDASDRTSWARVADDEDDRRLAAGYARHVKSRIAREASVPASVGVAPSMSVAKVASDHDKPDGLAVVPPGEARDFLAPLPVEAVHGVGPVTASALAEMGVETAGDVAAADPAVLRERFGERGRDLYDRARGVDDREVTPRGDPKSLSRESAFAAATDDDDRVRERVRRLAADVAERARSEGALYRTIGIKVVEPPFEVSTRARSLPGPVDDPDLVRETALALLEEFVGAAVRKVGVRLSKLSFAAGEQASLDGWDGTDGRAAGDGADRPGGAGRGQASLSEFDG